ncbi:MAG: PD-(D/E)XK nuclease family protein [Prevotellaceae bacterium]|jgi:RecB family exonuclease|nr:PD-(D/E)XK nuclease family protein [Prevotellaceae bacterium]
MEFPETSATSYAPFLKRTVRSLFARYGEQISALTLVFPSHRARLYFSEYLSQQLSRPLWQPGSTGMGDVFARISGLAEASRYRLVAEIYKSYTKFRKTDESFEHFYPWGEVMLNDFDALDKYLVQVDPLLRNLAALKGIDGSLSFLSEEQRAAVQTFWQNFSPGQNGRLQASFASLWSALLPTYNDFRQTLRKENLAYEGMIYREGAEILLKNGFDFGAEKFVFIGFNALNECEKVLMRRLQEEQRAEFFWDYDRYYIDDRHQEAGLFMRQNLSEFPPLDADEDDASFSEKKDIQIIATTSDVLQAKLLPTLLSEVCGDRPLDRRTAIVLADEGLLIPALYSLPPDIEMLNVTMGYPLSQTPIYSLTELLISLHKNAREAENQPTKFYHKDVLALLQHQYVRMVAGKEARALCGKIVRQNRAYVTAEDLATEADDRSRFPVQQLFAKFSTPDAFTSTLGQLMADVAAAESREDSFDGKLRREYVACAYKALNRLMEALRESGMELELSPFFNLLRSALKNIRIPFEGEPVAGLQLIGVLETRALDFEAVVALSLNDDIFPRGEAMPSLIPYNLRRGFGLPSVEHHEAMYAYYFYRLLQRARRVRLVYNSQGSDNRSGEMSRYLRQLIMESPHNVPERSISYSVTRTPAKPVTVEKTGAVAAALAEYLNGGERAISASSLNSYIACPLKFYFSQIARLKEPEEVDEEIDGRTLGNIFHHAMQSIYAPRLGQRVLAEDIEAMLQNRQEITTLAEKETAREVFSDEKEVAEILRNGKILMVKETVVKYIEGTLRYDMHRAPFTVAGLEKKVEHQLQIDGGQAGRAVNFSGYIDRVDAIADGSVQIIDYKTGSSLNGKKTKFLSVESLFSEKDAERRPEILQTLLYSSIVLEKGEAAAVLPVLLFVRNTCRGDFDGSIKIKSGTSYAAVSDAAPLLPRFGELLRATLNSLFDVSQPFTQTSDAEACALCPYSEICHR